MEDNDLSYESITELLTDAVNKEKSAERRKKRDKLTIMPVVLSSISLVMVIAVWIILDIAAPPKYYGWLTLFENYNPGDSTWQARPVNISYIMLLVSMVLCVIAFICNRMRLRRRGDKYMVSVFLVGSIVLITLVSFLVTFLPMNLIGNWK